MFYSFTILFLWGYLLGGEKLTRWLCRRFSHFHFPEAVFCLNFWSPRLAAEFNSIGIRGGVERRRTPYHAVDFPYHVLFTIPNHTTLYLDLPLPYRTILYWPYNSRIPIPFQTMQCHTMSIGRVETIPYTVWHPTMVPYPWHPAVVPYCTREGLERTLWWIKKGGPDLSWGQKQIEGTKHTSDKQYTCDVL